MRKRSTYAVTRVGVWTGSTLHLVSTGNRKPLALADSSAYRHAPSMDVGKEGQAEEDAMQSPSRKQSA
eukprot:2025846-Rhodomonas_salina.1